MANDSPISKELIDMLACPACKSAVTLTSNRSGIRCDSCRLVYPIKDGIPVMLIDKATPDIISAASKDSEEI
jgi:uncharacterized protein YbaR (Trm112 family)